MVLLCRHGMKVLVAALVMLLCGCCDCCDDSSPSKKTAGSSGPAAEFNESDFGFVATENDTSFVITTSQDFADGSFREAVHACNEKGGSCVIEFSLDETDPGHDSSAGTWTLTFEDTPPSITVDNVSINGFSQTENRGDTNPEGPEIVMSGSGHTIEYAFSIINASNITIKGFVIVEFLYGIQVYGRDSHRIRIYSSYIGTDHTGLAGAGNFNGIEILSGAHDVYVGGLTAAERNVISGNQHAGLRISDADHNYVKGNLVGVDKTGTAAIPNYDGISVEGKSAGNLIGGTTEAERNIASGNVAYGVDIFGAGAKENVIIGNYIGTDIRGSYAIPNTYGLLFDDRSSFNVVGGYNKGEWNLISGNTAFGAYIYNNGTNNNKIIGNRIGTSSEGTAAVPNETGVWIDGAAYENTVDANLISGNTVSGITIFAILSDRNIVTKNLIGTDITGEAPLPNGRDGIRIAHGPADNIIGGSVENANIIGYNGTNGISIESYNSFNNTISCNSFISNSSLGIDIFPEGTNTNDAGDADTGPNALMNSPVINSAACVSGTCTITGTLDTISPEMAFIEVYIAGLTKNGFYEGGAYLGTAIPDSAGTWTYFHNTSESEIMFTATATDASGSTSEFSVEY